jgi:hypothetical protein
MLTYTNKVGTIYILPDDSYGAITAAEMDGDHEGLIMLLGACPKVCYLPRDLRSLQYAVRIREGVEYTGRMDALHEAAEKGDAAMVKAIVAIAVEEVAGVAEFAGHAELAAWLREQFE